MKHHGIRITASLGFICAIAAFLALSGSTVTSQLGFSQQEIVWIDNYSEAITQAKLTGKPVFLEFRCVP